jgi:CHASE2 domain-containing sensor protein
VESAADAAIVLEWGAVSGYFLWRWFRHRRLVSFCLAAMALGWLLMGLLEAREPHVVPVKAAALGLGLVLWYSIWRVERAESKKEGP